MEISVKHVREKLREALDRVDKGEQIVITKRGKPVANITAVKKKPKRLPDLSEFRQSIGPPGHDSASLIREERDSS